MQFSSVTQLRPTLCDLCIHCSPPGSSVHGVLQARILEWVAIPASQGIFLTQGSNPGLLHYKQILYHLSYQESPQQIIAPTQCNQRKPECSHENSATKKSCQLFKKKKKKEWECRECGWWAKSIQLYNKVLLQENKLLPLHG